MAIDHVSVDTAPVFRTASDSSEGRIANLLWGDRVRVIGTSGAFARVKARGREGYVRKSALGGPSLLEVYFIDVGQGDGVLIRTPDHRHVLIDGGFPRRMQPSGKNAADFVDWKFVKDYGGNTIALDAVIASHNDEDHYGGLSDLLSADPQDAVNLDATSVTVESFYHAGLSWWKRGESGRTLGDSASSDQGRMWTQLLGDRAAVQAALQPGAGARLAGNWAKLFSRVLATRTRSGAPTRIARLNHAVRYLPGFEAGPGKASLQVLAPVEFSVAGKPALRRFTGSDSQNTNGQSVLLRLDYGRARILLTGDLNAASQDALLRDYAGELQQFECDVVKACHHGSDDVSYRFLQTLRPGVTVISSGDNEGHDHPRPSIVAASATTGYLEVQDDRIVTPLVYSTELARSHKFASPTQLSIGPVDAPTTVLKASKLDTARLHLPKKSAASREPIKKVSDALVLSDLVYGLVNVRTDGETILCATLSEQSSDWEIKTLRSRF
jgi:beta-lactamase superfamily II metal-dependent hydrolase